MNLSLAYDGDELVIKIPDGTAVDRFAPVLKREQYASARFIDSFKQGGGMPVVDSPSPLIVVNDGYRHTPTNLILEWLDQFDDSLLDRARFLVSTGTHAKPTADHYKQVFGSYFERVEDRVAYHDATDMSSMTMIGLDSFNHEVWLNSAVIKAEQVIVIGSVEPHYFAGYTGGRKSIFPGLTDLATIERNHNLANSLEAAPLKLVGNPVSEHFSQLMALVDQEKLFGVQVVADASHQIADIYCGPLRQAFENAAALASDIFAHRADGQYDVVLCELLPPLDKNLYQVQKALENCQTAVADGGAVIVFAACREGIGSDYFFDLAARWDRERNQPIDGKPTFGSHKLSRVNSIGKRIDVRLYSKLSKEIPRQVFYEPLDDVEGYLKEKKRNKDSFRLAVVYDAGHTVLTIT